MLGLGEIFVIFLLFFAVILVARYQAKRICPDCGLVVRGSVSSCPDCQRAFHSQSSSNQKG
ncbi:hypothetical protein CMK19_20820 [Candidatus Poribacteria bacterium]|nr:hypothetical protein [Candidatus Poribacteria bacterium]